MISLSPHEDDRAALKHEMEAEEMIREDEESADNTRSNNTGKRLSPAAVERAHRDLLPPLMIPA